MMMLYQQQQSKVNKISESHRQASQKVNNFVDQQLASPNNGPSSNQQTPQTKHHPVSQSTDFAQQNKISLNQKFQSAPTTPTRVMSGKRNSEVSQPAVIVPQLIERNVITKYAFATRVGFIPNNPNKVNQDSFILSPNLNGCNFRHYFGVCDGHGQNGKEASHFIKLRLSQLVGNFIKDNLGTQTEKQSPTDQEYKDIFHRAFMQCNEELDYTNFDVNLR